MRRLGMSPTWYRFNASARANESAVRLRFLQSSQNFCESRTGVYSSPQATQRFFLSVLNTPHTFLLADLRDGKVQP